MTCKNCIHYEMCRSLGIGYWEAKPTLQIFLDKTKPEDCGHFKDRSKFIDLPCNVGDVIYIPQRKRISVHKVVSFYIGFGNTVFMNLTPIEGYLVSYLNVGDIGKKAFLTSEECEQALKRCNNE